jgi:hypothetical protein
MCSGKLTRITNEGGCPKSIFAPFRKVKDSAVMERRWGRGKVDNMSNNNY